jgi:hypothetical protein
MYLPRKYPLNLVIQTGKIEAWLKEKIIVIITINPSAEVSVILKIIVERAKLII